MHPIKFHKRLSFCKLLPQRRSINQPQQYTYLFITESSGGKKVENKNALIYFRGPR